MWRTPTSPRCGRGGHRVPTWVGPLHRRYEVQRYFTAGATGAVCASYGYQSTQLALATQDAWVSRALVSGEITKTPGTDLNLLRWTGSADLTLSVSNGPQFITLGNVGPVESSIYTITFDMRWNVLPKDLTTYMSFAFGHADDRYYEARSGQGRRLPRHPAGQRQSGAILPTATVRPSVRRSHRPYSLRPWWPATTSRSSWRSAPLN